MPQRYFARVSCLLRTAACLSVAVGCGGQNATVAAQSSPSAAMNAYYDAAKRQDGAALKKLLSASSLKSMENPSVSIERVLVAMTQPVPKSRPQIRNEKIDGDTATLEVQNVGENRWDTVMFVKEGGVWKMAVDKMQKARER